MNKDLYYQLRAKSNLRKAWNKVYENGSKSDSIDTKNDIKNFSIKSETHLTTIQKHLRLNKYRFAPSIGITISRKGKDPRPIVLSDVRDKVIRRAILNVLQSQEAIKEYVNVPTSFGGIEGQSVKNAIYYLCKNVKSGLIYYITSDIKKFFTRIPRLEVIKILNNILPDLSLQDILDQASKTELDNLSQLGTKKELFPSHELGVAQGYCLSPLFGNIILHEFDTELNSNPSELLCLRYIDDFIILGKSDALVTNAFQRARKILKSLGMDTYTPSDSSGKAKMGKVINGLNYLGCFINDCFVHPSRKSRTDFVARIHQLIKVRSKQLKHLESKSWDRNYSFIATLQEINNILMGWGNQYSFCNAKDLFKNIDTEISNLLDIYFKEYDHIKNRLFQKDDNVEGLRRLLGIYLLQESCDRPILPFS
jgi:RNA-directed DNA polymerase